MHLATGYTQLDILLILNWIYYYTQLDILYFYAILSVVEISRIQVGIKWRILLISIKFLLLFLLLL